MGILERGFQRLVAAIDIFQVQERNPRHLQLERHVLDPKVGRIRRSEQHALKVAGQVWCLGLHVGRQVEFDLLFLLALLFAWPLPIAIAILRRSRNIGVLLWNVPRPLEAALNFKGGSRPRAMGDWRHIGLFQVENLNAGVDVYRHGLNFRVLVFVIVSVLQSLADAQGKENIDKLKSGPKSGSFGQL